MPANKSHRLYEISPKTMSKGGYPPSTDEKKIAPTDYSSSIVLLYGPTEGGGGDFWTSTPFPQRGIRVIPSDPSLKVTGEPP